jgi:uncharacterized protein YciI
MMSLSLRCLAPAVIACSMLLPVLQASGQTAPAAKPKQFVYVLRLVPRLHDDKAWTEADKQAGGRHVARLKEAAERGQVILAGRTNEPGDKTFGLVIFEAADEAAAREFMQGDPTLPAGVMTAELHPYTVALSRKP